MPYGTEYGLANLAAQMAYGESPLGPKLEVPTAYRDWRDQREIRFIGSYDFVMDRTEDGRQLKVLPIVDEYTRECLHLEVQRSITKEDVVAILAKLFLERGEPKSIHSDNGPEFIAKAVKGWLEAAGAKTLYIEPGSPWENAYSESFNSRFRDELLHREEFSSVLEAKVLAGDYQEHYNHQRPHSALNYQTPAEFGARCAAAMKEDMMNLTRRS